MKFSLLFFSLFCVLSIAACSQFGLSGQRVLHVSKDCNRQSDCYKSIQQAVDQAIGSETVIRIAAGEYEEKVYINTP